jgi:RimJ/RimL family protein N-acetyltransferase
MVLKLSDPVLHLRTITIDDQETLCQIYSGTRTEELAQLTDWTAGQKEAFLRSQFMAQHTYYQNNYEGANFWVIESRAKIIGRLYLHTHYEAASMRIIDIALLPEWRNNGIGTQILLDVMESAGIMNRPLTIHVESFNRAMRLYKKLGFVLISRTNGVYHLLEWKSSPQASRKNIDFKHRETYDSCTTAFNSL